MKRWLWLLAFAAMLAAPLAFPASAYRSLRITAPKDGATMHENSGKLAVSARLSPRLAATDRLQLIVDGALAAEARSGVFRLADLPRGAHTLEAQVVDASGAVLLRSAPIVVNVWQASALAPNRRRP